MLPNFIGIGAPKAGTTWLYKCLGEHPEVFMPAHKEPYFFDYDTIEGRWDEYEVHFIGSEGHNAIGEMSTRYLTSQQAPARIKQHIPNVRLLVALRNPVEQVYSHYWHLLRQNFHQWDRSRIPDSFEEALKMYPEKLLAPAYYHKHLRLWLEHFEQSQLHPIFHDDIREDPHQVVQGLYAFLDVNPDFIPQSLNRRGASVRRGVSLGHSPVSQAYAPLYDVLNRRIYQSLKRTISTKRAVWLKDKLQVRRLLEHVFMQPGYPEMQPETRAFLREHFSGDVQNLALLLDRDLSHWR